MPIDTSAQFEEFREEFVREMSSTYVALKSKDIYPIKALPVFVATAVLIEKLGMLEVLRRAN